jgi:hypothetical protein
MIRRTLAALVSVALLSFVLVPPRAADADQDAHGYTPLFPTDGAPTGWRVSEWNDVSKPAKDGVHWKVENGVLHGSEPRGTWLVSENVYGDFVLEFEFKLGERGNSGIGIRIPEAGDPAFDGLEIQMCDARYNDPPDTADKLTGALYWAVEPKKQVYKPLEWNRYQITAKGANLKVVLNDEVIQDVNLDDHKKPLQRHNGLAALSLSQRPRKGHIGFQELSRGGAHVMIRNARIKELDQ